MIYDDTKALTDYLRQLEQSERAEPNKPTLDDWLASNDHLIVSDITLINREIEAGATYDLMEISEESVYDIMSQSLSGDEHYFDELRTEIIDYFYNKLTTEP